LKHYIKFLLSQKNKNVKKLLFVVLLNIFISNAQSTYTYGTGGNVLENGKKLNSTLVREKFTGNYKLLEMYDAGRNKKTWGNVLFYGGFGLAALNLTLSATAYVGPGSNGQPSVEKVPGPQLAIIGGVLTLVSIPIKVGYPKRIKSAIELMNTTGEVTPKKVAYQLNISPSVNGMAIRLTF
jgi:hypothetical protein